MTKNIITKHLVTENDTLLTISRLYYGKSRYEFDIVLHNGNCRPGTTIQLPYPSLDGTRYFS
ncbi:hypothetical protein LCGC14_1779420 [marine sediment metagenome]|uniref:LysM domain-containing protein n=1 Tax=marine sediment metagenome TaxID=412755 RepID=A0A0F9GVZ3_9ZZZZ